MGIVWSMVFFLVSCGLVGSGEEGNSKILCVSSDKN